jgi:tetratricopeptide (TPR) repeat protein
VRDDEVVYGMSRKILVLILCLTALSVGARSAEQRPMVGFLPLQGNPGTYTHVIPELICWQISRIPGVGIVDTGSMMDCIQLDKLSIPANIGDTTRYSRLAADTGVNYVVVGAVEQVSRSSVRFRLIVCSASSPRFRSEQVYESGLSDLPATAVRAAKWIASQVRVPVAADIEFDTAKILPEALRLIDQSSRLCTGCEADQSVLNRSLKLATRAQTLCPSSQMASEWTRYSSFFRQRGMGYPRFRRRPGMGYGGFRRNNDFSPPFTVSADGKVTWRLSGAWRADLENTRGLRRDSKRLKSYLAALTDRHPRSAYLHYSAGRVLSARGEWPDMFREYSAALSLNPDSFRLRMRLVSAYIDWHKNDKALAALQPAIKRWPNYSECHLQAAAIYRAQNRYGKAADEMKTVIELDPAFVNHRTLAEDYLRAGKVVESAREAAKADEGLRQGIITFSLVLSGVFVLGVLGMALLVKILLRT